MALNRFELGQDKRGESADAPVISTDVNVLVLSANVKKDLVVPTGSHFAVVTSTATGYMKPDAAAAVPAADKISGEAPTMLLATEHRRFQVTGKSYLSFISGSNALVCVEFYS